MPTHAAIGGNRTSESSTPRAIVTGPSTNLPESRFLDAKAVIDHAALRAAGLGRGGKDGVRLLAKGEFNTKATFKVDGASKGALEAVQKAGGSVEVPEAGPSEAEKKAARAAANKAAK